MPDIERLPYVADVARRFAVLADEPWAAWLDSGYPEGGGRYDVCVAAPYARLVTRGNITELTDAEGGLVTAGERDPIDWLRDMLGETAHAGPQPFAGGALGYFGYDLGRRFENLPRRPAPDAWPEMAVGLYDWALITDHAARRSWIASAGRDPRGDAVWRDRLTALREPPGLPAVRRPARLGPLETNLSRAAYDQAFDRLQRYIHDGDCYQANFAQRFSARLDGRPWEAYRWLRAHSPSPFAAYLNYPFGQVLSTSPEQFLEVNGRHVTTRPIKGTRPRGRSLAADEALATELRLSPKDRAENLMIVDLLRNDLGKVCRPGSVRVPRLFALETFASVHHLVSEVRGELRDGVHALDLLRGCFPGGSITGAPKRRAMEIIDELEPDRRDVYCGSIGWIGFDGAMRTNIAIRTALWRDGQVSYWAGGGIVADSSAAAEYQETLVKAAAFFRLLGVAPDANGPMLATV